MDTSLIRELKREPVRSDKSSNGSPDRQLISGFGLSRPADEDDDDWAQLARVQKKPKPRIKRVKSVSPKSAERSEKRKTKYFVLKASPKSRPQLFNKPILKSLIKMVSPQKSRATSPKLKARAITALGFPRVKSSKKTKRLGTSLTARSPKAKRKQSVSSSKRHDSVSMSKLKKALMRHSSKKRKTLMPASVLYEYMSIASN